MEQDLATLILKYLKRTTSESENALLDQWKNESDANRQRFDELTNQVMLRRKVIAWNKAGGDEDAAWASLHQQLQSESSVPVKKMFFIRKYWYVAAAIVVVVFASGLYLRMANRTGANNVAGPEVVKENNRPPAGNVATLTLSNGQSILLDSIADGVLAKEGNADLIKNEGILTYSTSMGQDQEKLYNTLTVPKGGKYRLLLSDGTKVWLNSASSIRYPTVFESNERRVEINGEAYFEVAPRLLRSARNDEGRNDGEGEKIPFIVNTSKGMQIEVLGTHFNVNAYEDEQAVKTTLLEGKVKVTWLAKNEKRSSILQPGEQAVAVKDELLTLKNGVDLEEVIAWKDGRFYFNNSEFPSVMRQIARWYDVEVVYEGKLPAFKLTGESSRNVSLVEFLKIIQMSDVKCRIEGKKLFIPEQ